MRTVNEPMQIVVVCHKRQLMEPDICQKWARFHWKAVPRYVHGDDTVIVCAFVAHREKYRLQQHDRHGAGRPKQVATDRRRSKAEKLIH